MLALYRLGTLSFKASFVASLWLALLLGGAEVRAQDAAGEPADSNAETESAEPTEANPARDAYFRGLAAADEQRWDDALAAFEESFAGSGRTPLLLNIAVAQQALARYVAAAATIERLHGREDIDAATSRAAEALNAELDTRIAVLDIRRSAGSSLRVDGVVSTDERVAVNPGSHVIYVEEEGFLAHRQELEAEPGQVHRVNVTLLPRETMEIDPRRRRRRILGVVGAVVVAAVAATVVGLMLRSENAEAPTCPPGDLCFEVRP